MEKVCTDCRLAALWRYTVLQPLSFASCTVDPEIIMVGGGVSRAGDTLLNPVRRHFRKYAYHPCVDTPIVAAELGNDAGIYGCAAMVLGIS